MGYSRIETPFAGGSQVFPVTFSLGYLNKADVTAYVQGEVDGSGNHAYRAFTWTDADHITVTAPLPNPCVLVTERTVSKNILTGNLGNGGDVTRSTVDRAVRQLMMVTHELMDGRVADFSEIDLLTGFVTAANNAKTVAEAQAALASADRILAQAGAATASAGAATATTKAGEASASATAAAASAAAADVTRGGTQTFTGINTFTQYIKTPIVRAVGAVWSLLNSAGTDTFIDATENGAVRLFHDNTPRLTTDATGVAVNGTIKVEASELVTNLDTLHSSLSVFHFQHTATGAPAGYGSYTAAGYVIGSASTMEQTVTVPGAPGLLVRTSTDSGASWSAWVVATTSTNLGQQTANILWYEVGSYVFACQSQGNYAVGVTRPGSSLRTSGFHMNGAGVISGGVLVNLLTGSWMCMGHSYGVPGNTEGATLWKRVV